jgi:hypothetical protein
MVMATGNGPASIRWPVDHHPVDPAVFAMLAAGYAVPFPLPPVPEAQQSTHREAH